ncbi:MAG: hypothetical protein ABIP71_12385 [Verrucomicrobiota bacterium]
MNEAQIEDLLRKTPRLNVPQEVEEKLRQDIRLPRVVFSQNIESGIGFPWKRWLSATICLVFALTAVAMQFKTLIRLKKENAGLQFATQNLEQLRRDNMEFKKLMLASEDIERLRKDNAELLKLRAEVSQLRTATAGLENLRAKNKTIETQVIANANTNNDFFAEQQARAERIACVNNLKQIGLSARIWALDHKAVYPSDFISMKNELGTPKVVKCPTDKSRAELTWEDVAAGNVSYTMDAPGISENEPSVVFVECPIHHNFCMVDGSVQQLSIKRMEKGLKVVNGRKVFQE